MTPSIIISMIKEGRQAKWCSPVEMCMCEGLEPVDALTPMPREWVKFANGDSLTIGRGSLVEQVGLGWQRGRQKGEGQSSEA